MAATFDHVTRYSVEARCITPLRSGDLSGDVQNVLHRRDGTLFVQGSSLNGALRAWLHTSPWSGQEEVLFGTQAQGGTLILSDAVFEQNASVVQRPRLRINERTGSALNGAKFDVAHVAAGSVLHFSLTLCTRDDAPAQQDAVERMLSALHQGEVRLGAQKSNGFGRVSLEVKKQTFDLHQEKERTAWLDDVPGGSDLTLPTVQEASGVHFTVEACVDRMLVKAGAPIQEKQKGEQRASSYIPHLTENDCPVVPGSSVKGAVLHRVRQIADLLHVEQAQLVQAFGSAPDAEEHLPCLFRFEDAYLEPESRRKITRIRVDRITGGVIRGGLFAEEPSAGPITLQITGPTGHPQACALLLYALRDLALGLYNLGSGGAVGRGFLHVKRITGSMGPRQFSLEFDGSGGCELKDGSGLAAEWMNALGGMTDEA